MFLILKLFDELLFFIIKTEIEQKISFINKATEGILFH